MPNVLPYTRYALDMQGTCTEHAKDMHRTCTGHAQNEHAQNMNFFKLEITDSVAGH